MRLKNGKKLRNERWITFFRETERYVNDVYIYNRSKNGTNLWDDLTFLYRIHFILCRVSYFTDKMFYVKTIIKTLLQRANK